MDLLRPAVTFLLAATLAACGGRGEAGEHDRGASSVPAPPDGMRWVGSGQVVVAVPEWWTTGETRCLAPEEDTVYFDTGAVADCAQPGPAPVREVSALAVLDAGSGYGQELVRGMEPAGEVDGHQVLERPGCEHWFEDVCRRVFAVPSEGVVLAVTLTDDAGTDHQQVRDSLRILRQPATTVPLATRDGWTPAWGAEPAAAEALVATLEDAGFRVEVTTVAPSTSRSGSTADLPEGSLLDVEPALGSPAEVGSTVRVSVMGAAGR